MYVSNAANKSALTRKRRTRGNRVRVGGHSVRLQNRRWRLMGSASLNSKRGEIKRRVSPPLPSYIWPCARDWNEKIKRPVMVSLRTFRRRVPWEHRLKGGSIFTRRSPQSQTRRLMAASLLPSGLPQSPSKKSNKARRAASGPRGDPTETLTCSGVSCSVQSYLSLIICDWFFFF